jgi:hypothetical protein
MHTLRVTQRAGEDGTLHLSVPLLTPGSEYEVVVMVHSKEMEPAPAASEDLGRPPGDFESTSGSITDEAFVCPSQREMPGAVDYPSAPLSEGLESVDWELEIESPPPRPSRTVTVKFEKGTCRRPRIVANPEE